MKVIVVGSNGQLGQCIQDQIKQMNVTDEYILYSKSELDITKFNDVERIIEDVIPNIVINASGFTNVDEAENRFTDANNINNLSVKNLAELCKRINATLIHISTDYVFDGDANIPYKEDDKKLPISKYGKTKLSGENSIILSGCFYIIIRTSWVFSEHGKNFMKSMLNLFLNKEIIKVVNDQIGCPTYAQDIAKVILRLIENIKEGRFFQEIFHFTGNQQTTWFDFAEAILKEKQKDDKNVQCKLIPIKSCEYKTLAKRPKFSVLDCSKLHNQLNIESSDWNKAISNVIVNLKN
jgi:dTDP-4-dehydrorhamnose reductase